MQAGSETVQSAVGGVTEAQHATVDEHEHAEHERGDGARPCVTVPGNTHKVHMQSHTHIQNPTRNVLMQHGKANQSVLVRNGRKQT